MTSRMCSPLLPASLPSLPQVGAAYAVYMAACAREYALLKGECSLDTCQHVYAVGLDYICSWFGLYTHVKGDNAGYTSAY